MAHDPIRALHLSYTKRWVIAPTYRDQSVAEHSFRVMLIADALCRTLGFYLHQMLYEVMFHDYEEQTTGDIPGSEKSKVPGYLKPVDELTFETCLLKVADSIETGTYWVQWGNGPAWHGHPSNNAPARDVNKIFHYSQKYPGLLTAAMEVWRNITGMEMPVGGHTTGRTEGKGGDLRPLSEQRTSHPADRGGDAGSEGLAAAERQPASGS